MSEIKLPNARPTKAYAKLFEDIRKRGRFYEDKPETPIPRKGHGNEMIRCNGRVWYRDVLRYSGRGKSGFEREWTWRQCKRFTMDDTGFCHKHLPKMDESATSIPAPPAQEPRTLREK